MKKFQVVFLSILLISLLLSALFRLLGYEEYQAISGAPALIVLCLIFLGHFVTLDEDLADGWSNPDNSKKIALLSVGELLLKFAALLFGLWLVLI
ncbi:MAG: hypothetical protein ABJJ44_15320 [Paraglaciecola sp.]|uniref:hypothetical protein n=1 Tax=Paraglaciecola sp. TaxID=1920173 RepID=UPI00329A4DA3